MFLVLSMTASGSILALAALLLRRVLGRRLGGAERWIWLPVLLRLCVPLSGPVHPVGDAFQRLQLMAWDGYTQLESNWLLGPGRAPLLDKLRAITAALPENANAFPLGTVKSPVPVSLPIPLDIRLRNPNTWLVIWLVGAIICFCLTLWLGWKKPLRFRWFSAAVLSLHWFNPLMIPVRRALAHPVPGAEEGTAKANPLAVLCAAGLLALGIALGVLPGGLGTDLFHGADRYALDELTGGEHWNRFLRRVEAGRPAAVRIVLYFNPDWPFFYDIYYDGERFQVWEPDGNDSKAAVRYRDNYGYLIPYTFETYHGQDSPVDRSLHYYLVDDPNTDVEAIWWGPLLSSPPFTDTEPVPKWEMIFTDLIYKEIPQE